MGGMSFQQGADGKLHAGASVLVDGSTSALSSRARHELDALVVVLHATRLGRRSRAEAEEHARRRLAESWCSAHDVLAAARPRRCILLLNVDRYSGRCPLDTNAPGHLAQVLQLLQYFERGSLHHATRVGEHTTRKRRDRAEAEEATAERRVRPKLELDVQGWARLPDIEVDSDERWSWRIGCCQTAWRVSWTVCACQLFLSQRVGCQKRSAGLNC